MMEAFRCVLPPKPGRDVRRNSTYGNCILLQCTIYSWKSIAKGSMYSMYVRTRVSLYLLTTVLVHEVLVAMLPPLIIIIFSNVCEYSSS